MCDSYNRNLELEDIVVLTSPVFTDGAFSFLRGEVGEITEFVPSQKDWLPGEVPPKAIVRMLGYGGYRAPIPTAFLVKLELSACNGDLTRCLQSIEDKKKVEASSLSQSQTVGDMLA